MKRAQIEIIGLLMVVILLVFIILLALWFVLGPAQQNLVPQRQAIEAKSILITLMKTTYVDNDPGGIDVSFKEKIIECQEHDGIPGDPLANCAGTIQNEIKSILNKILKNKEYTLGIKDESNDPASPFMFIEDNLGGNCDADNSQKTVGEVILKSGPLIKAKLTLCSRAILV